MASALGVHAEWQGDDHRIALYRARVSQSRLEAKPFINIGAGSFYHPYWTNLDFISDWYRTVQKEVVHFDLTAKGPLPFPDNSIEVAYTSHTIEHVKEDAVAVLFQEVHRVLVPSGIFRVTTGPDAETDYRALLANDADWFYWDEAYVRPGTFEAMYLRPATSAPLAERWLRHVATALAPNDKSPGKKYSEPEILAVIDKQPMEAALDHFCGQVPYDPVRPGNHVSWWTHEKVLRFMRDAGFQAPYRSGYQQSASPFMRRSRLFDSTHPQITVHCEAVKEGSR